MTSAGSDNTIRVAVVDDEPLIVQAATIMLEIHGYEVDGYEDPIDALNRIREEPSRYDAVVTDYMMPKMNGEEFALSVRRIRTNHPVVITTANPNIYSATLARVSGFGFCSKPYGAESLLAAVRLVTGSSTDAPADGLIIKKSDNSAPTIRGAFREEVLE